MHVIVSNVSNSLLADNHHKGIRAHLTPFPKEVSTKVSVK